MTDVTQRDILWTLQEILKALHAIEKQLLWVAKKAQDKEREG